MSKPEQPCESSESYSFTACVKNSISRRIGCRLEWDSWSSRDIQLCSTVKQLEEFDKEYFNLFKLHQENLVRNTGCFIPCSYTDYKLATVPKKFAFEPQVLSLQFSSPNLLERTEQLLYPADSFISEFGGALGLFLGFSCIMIWDCLEFLFQNCLKYFSSD